MTPEKKKQRINLQKLCNSIKSAYSFGRIKSWQDVSSFVPNENKGELTFVALKQFCDKLLADFDNPPKKEEPPKQQEPPKQEQHEDFNSSNDYGLHPSPSEKASLFWFQKKAVKEMWDNIQAGKKGQLLLAGTGTGKTFMAAALVRRLVDAKYHEGKTFGVTNYLYVTRATIVEQTKRVFQDDFNLGIKDGVEILNIEQLRSRAGSAWVNEEIKIVNGQETSIWKWRKMLSPVVILWDECQALKNEGSTQHQIAAAVNDLGNVVQVFISATPFTRVIEAKCFAVATGKSVADQLSTGGTLNLNTWPTYASAISGSQSTPSEYNEAAVERLVKDLESYIVRVKGVRPQFDAVNSIKMISFKTPEERIKYESAYERFLKRKAKLEAEQEAGTGGGSLAILVELLMFRMEAELIRAEYLADQMYESVCLGKASVCALNFKNTIIKVVQVLNEKYGVPREQISIVWGGGQTQLNKKQKAKKAIQEKAAQLKELGLDSTDLLEDLDLDDVEEREIINLPEHLRLGIQSKDERQREIDRFQSGRTLYCLYTFRAGGVGLSLHHTDQMSKVKVRKQKNGYAVLEDIPKVPVRQRINFVAPTYSAIELVQGLGRTPRLTSLSDSPQVMVFYRGTVEEGVARIVSQKLRCLSKVVRTREKWADVVVGAPVEAHLEDESKITNESQTDYDNLNNEEEDDE